jgi:hypothetical protein
VEAVATKDRVLIIEAKKPAKSGLSVLNQEKDQKIQANLNIKR